MANYLPIRTRKEIQLVKTELICYIMQEKRHVLIYTMNGERYNPVGKVNDYLEYLGEEFLSVKRYTIVNFGLIEAVEDKSIVFFNGETIWLGKNNYQKARRFFLEYIENTLAKEAKL